MVVILSLHYIKNIKQIQLISKTVMLDRYPNYLQFLFVLFSVILTRDACFVIYCYYISDILYTF